MRVLHVIPEALRPGPTELGAAALLRSLPAGLVRCEVALLAGEQLKGSAEVVTQLEQAGAEVRVVTAAGLRALAPRFDLVHVHSWRWEPILAELPHPKILSLYAHSVLPRGADADLVAYAAPAFAENQVHAVPTLTGDVAWSSVYARFGAGLPPIERASGWKQARDPASLTGRSARGEVTRSDAFPEAGRWSCATAGDPELEVVDLLVALVRARRPKRVIATGQGAAGLHLVAVAEALRLATEGRMVAVVEPSAQAAVERTLERAGLLVFAELVGRAEAAVAAAPGAEMLVVHGPWRDRVRDLPVLLPALAPGALVFVPDTAPQFEADARPARQMLLASGYSLLELPTPRGVTLAQRA